MSFFTQLTRWIRSTALMAVVAAGPATIGQAAYGAGLLTPHGQSASLTIAAHDVDVTIEDGYAITRVEQQFRNPHQQDLDAVYSFPVPEQAAVTGFTVWIDGEPVLGEVFEKEQARRIHEEEKQRGRDTGLAEKKGYKTFELNVSPIRAQSTTRLALTYMQPVALDAGVGRYLYPLEDGGVDQAQARFWKTQEAVQQFSFDMNIRTAVPVDAVRIPGYAASIKRAGPGEWKISISKQARTGNGSGDGAAEHAFADSINDRLIHSDQAGRAAGRAHQLSKDLVVYWRLAPDLPAQIDMITHKPQAGGRGTFMLVLTPGGELKPIERGKDWTFVIDMSGSMKGKFETVMQGLRMAFDKLDSSDRIRIIGFNREAWDVSGGFVAVNRHSTQQLLERMRTKGPGGGTNLYAGLSRATSHVDADRTTSVVLVTDGVANVGKTEHAAFLRLIKDRDVRLFTMVMGNSANRPLLHDMTDASGGFAISISNADDVVGQLLRAVGKVSHEAMHDIRFTTTGVRMADIVRSRDASLYYGDQLVLFGHYWGNGTAQLQIDTMISGQPRQFRTSIELPAVATDHPEIERLWAFSTVERLKRQKKLTGESDDLRSAIVDIATEHSIVTDYTSMLVLSQAAMQERGIERRNQTRSEFEAAARKRRASAPVASRRTDTGRPAFQGNRVSTHGGTTQPASQPQPAGRAGTNGGGSGSIDLLWLLLAALPLVMGRRLANSRRASRSESAQ